MQKLMLSLVPVVILCTRAVAGPPDPRALDRKALDPDLRLRAEVLGEPAAATSPLLPAARALLPREPGTQLVDPSLLESRRSRSDAAKTVNTLLGYPAAAQDRCPDATPSCWYADLGAFVFGADGAVVWTETAYFAKGVRGRPSLKDQLRGLERDDALTQTFTYRAPMNELDFTVLTLAWVGHYHSVLVGCRNGKDCIEVTRALAAERTVEKRSGAAWTATVMVAKDQAESGMRKLREALALLQGNPVATPVDAVKPMKLKALPR